MKKEELPDGWEWKRLEEIAEINSRFEKNAFDDDLEVTFLPMRCVEELTGRMDTSTERKYGEIKTGYTPIQEGDLLFAKITPCMENGKIAIARNLKNGIGFASTEFHTLKFSPDYETKFYLFFLMQEKIRQEAARNMTGTAGQHRVPATFLKRLKVPVPPLPIQRQIVAILEQAEAVKRQRQEADALTGALLQSVFYEMFGDPVRNERGWLLKNLGDVLHLCRNGMNLKQDKSGQGLPISRIETISYGVIDPFKVGYTQEFDDSIIETNKLIRGDILFSHINSLEHIGKTAIYESTPSILLHGINLLLLRPDTQVLDPIFLHFLLRKYRQEKIFWTIANKSVNQASINQTRLNNLKIPLPPLAPQQQFARVVESVERIRDQQVASGREIAGLCEGLMARAFKGELVV